jgi:hypothetical protein
VNDAPDSSAVRTALWRALHLELDDPPHLLEHEIGLALAAPQEGWRERGDMHPEGTRPYRAAIVAMTFMLPLELADEADRAGLEGAARGARASGTPWISFYEPEEIEAVAREAGFADVRSVPTAELAEPYLVGRTDGLHAASGEGILLTRT